RRLRVELLAGPAEGAGGIAGLPPEPLPELHVALPRRGDPFALRGPSAQAQPALDGEGEEGDEESRAGDPDLPARRLEAEPEGGGEEEGDGRPGGGEERRGDRPGQDRELEEEGRHG